MNLKTCMSCDCCMTRSEKIITKKEEGKIFSIKNSSERTISVCQIDGCLINNSDVKKCDLMFIVDNKTQEKIILVELKGKNYAKAIQQILQTASELKFSLLPDNVKRESFIVGSSHPKINSTMQVEMAKNISRFKSMKLEFPKVRTNKMEINI